MRLRGSAKALLFGLILVVLIVQFLSGLQTGRLIDRFEEINQRLERQLRFQQTARTHRTAERIPESAQNEKRGDWLVWAFLVEPKTLNQINVNRDIYSLWMTRSYIFEPLMAYDHETIELKPLLAKEYTVSDDGLEYTFVLRDDIHFSDGEPVTADDVIFTYETIMNPEINAATLAQSFVDVESAEKIDEKTVRFRMKRPYFKALEILSFWDCGIYPEHIYRFDDPQEFNQRVSNPVGSGPYVFERWTTGQEVVLRRNENYWGEQPNFDKLVFPFITNPLGCMQALRQGKVDMMIPEPEQFADATAEEGFCDDYYCLSYWRPGVPFYYIGWNQKRVFFQDRRVRLAMTHMIDREQVIASLLKGQGEITTGPFYIHGPQADPDIEPWPYDPAEARRLLDEAGWIDSDGDGIRDKDGVELSFRFMYTSSTAFYERLAKLLQDAGSAVGVEIIADPYEWSVLLPRVSNRDFDAMVLGWGGDIQEDPYQLWHSSQMENQGSNYVGFSNPRADEIIEQARRTLDDEKRNALYHEFHAILHHEQPYTFLYTRPYFRLADRRFENVNVYPLGLKYLEWYVPQEKQKYD